MLRDFLSAYRRAPGTLVRYRLWPYQFLPALISLLLAAGLFAICWFSAGALRNWLDSLIDVRLTWLDRSLSLAMTDLAFLALLTAFIFLHKHLALILTPSTPGTFA